VSLGPVRDGSGSGLREGVQALPPSVASLDLMPGLGAVREGGMARGTWCVELLDFAKRSVPAALELCAAFDQPGGQCGLVGRVCLTCEPPEEAEPGTLGAYLGQCAEVAGRLRGGGDDGLELTLEVDDEAAEADGAGELAGGGGEAGNGGGGFLGRVLGAMLPAAAPHVRRLRVLLASGAFLEQSAFPPGFSRHLVAPGLAFPLLTHLELKSSARERSMAAVDVAALVRLAAPRLCCIGLQSTACQAVHFEGAIVEPGSPCEELAVRTLAMGLPRPVGVGGLPVDATGHPTWLSIRIWFRSDPSVERDVRSVLAGAGREWAVVVWPPHYDGEGSTDGGTGSGYDCM
jgi:hypothetical protein